MDHEKFGSFLAAVRTEKGLTVRQLAGQLHITEKTLEQWEGGKRYPDLSRLPQIADLLGITPGELLSCERNPSDYTPPAEEEALVRDMIAYAGRVDGYRVSGMTFAIFSLLLVIGLFVCFLVNFLIERKFSWALYPLGSVIVLWLTAFPLFICKKHRIALSVIGFTVSTVLYLFLIEYLCPAKNWVIPLALPILAVLYATVPTIFLFLRRGRVDRSRATALSLFLVGLPVNLAIHALVGRYLGYSLTGASALAVAVILVAAGIITLSVGEIQRHLSRRKNHSESSDDGGGTAGKS